MTRVRWDRKRSSCPGVVVTKGQRGQKNTTLRGFEETAKPWKSEGSRHCLIFPSLFHLLRLSVAVSVRSPFPWLRRVPSRSFTRLALQSRPQPSHSSFFCLSHVSVDDRRQTNRFSTLHRIPLIHLQRCVSFKSTRSRRVRADKSSRRCGPETYIADYASSFSRSCVGDTNREKRRRARAQSVGGRSSSQREREREGEGG